jgi:transcription factor 7-like 2
LGSICGSVDDEIQTPDDDTESLNQSMSSPGGLSGLSSLQSPSTSLASPINLLASPSTPSIHHQNDPDSNGLVASLVNQLQRNKWQDTVSGKHKNGIADNHEAKRDNNNKNNNSNDVQIKTEPMDQSQSLTQQQIMQHQQQQQQMLMQQHQQRIDPFFYDKLPIMHRNPVGANPRDINNPLSVNQLTKRDFSPQMTGYYTHPFQKPLMAHPLAHSHPLAQFHAANFANFQLAAAAAAQNGANVVMGGKDPNVGNGGPHHRDDGNAISVT